MILSKNGVALVVMVLSLLGVNVSEGDMMTTISVIGQIVSLIFMAYNQISRGNIKNFIFKDGDN
jgi:hypothetical protein